MTTMDVLIIVFLLVGLFVVGMICVGCFFLCRYILIVKKKGKKRKNNATVKGTESPVIKIKKETMPAT